MLNFLSESFEFTHEDSDRLRRIEQKLDLILDHLGLEHVETWDLSPEARALADRGQKLGAIRLHRETTGVGLLRAKRDVEAYLDRNR